MSKPIQQVGSSAWLNLEKENITSLLAQELEEITYPAQHEAEWLNEHMASIFSAEKEGLDVMEVFKTPGRLRGAKTPLTARKKVLGERMPLTDIFSTQQATAASPKPESQPNTKFARDIMKMQIEKDDAVAAPAISQSVLKSQNVPLTKQVLDSGYHGLTEDEMDLDADLDVDNESQDDENRVVDAPEPVMMESQTQILTQPSRPSEELETEKSFHSAKEVASFDSKNDDVEMETAAAEDKDNIVQSVEMETVVDIVKDTEMKEESPTPASKSDTNADNSFEDDLSGSDASTPERPVVRKSSLNFAPLPARDPLPKRSMGARTSRTSYNDHRQSVAANRTSYFGRQTSGSRITQSHTDHVDSDMDVDSDRPDTRDGEESATEEPREKETKLHNMSSTQRLHEKINMLGKSQPSRPTKSIPSVAALANSQPTYPELPQMKNELDAAETEPEKRKSANADDADESWIRPLASPKVVRPNMFKSHTTDVMEQVSSISAVASFQQTKEPEKSEARTFRSPLRSPTRKLNPAGFGHKKASSTTEIKTPRKEDFGPALNRQNTIAAFNTSTTPVGSPRRVGHDGPLSASKSKLQSIMKSAKGLFSTSGNAATAAKNEALSSPTAPRSPDHVKNPGYPSLTALFDPPQSPVREAPPSLFRSNSQSEKEEKRKELEAKERAKMEENLEKARQEERERPRTAMGTATAQAKTTRPESKLARPTTRAGPDSTDRETEPSSDIDSNKTHATSVYGSQPGPKRELRHPVKANTLQKPKPQPVSIKVGTFSTRGLPLSTPALASGLGESLPPSKAASQQPSQPPNLTKKASVSSINSASSAAGTSLKNSVAGKPRAVVAAEKKKEAAEKEAQRKADAKREFERRRALVQQQEEARKQEAKRREEEKREREKAAAQKALAEKKKAETAKKLEMQQQRQQANELAAALQAEKQAQNSQRNDIGSARPPSRLNPVAALNRSVMSIPAPNPAKPPKRPAAETEETARAAPKTGNAYQADNKRRKSEENGEMELPSQSQSQSQPPMRPTKAPPIRQSNIGKNTIKSIFSHGYTNAPPPPSHNQGPSSFKTSTSTNPRPPPHMEMSKYANGKIPFADAPNPPGSSSTSTTTAHLTKTPSTAQRPTQHLYTHAPPTAQKSSPRYPNGELITLPDIPTDDDSDSSSDDSPSKEKAGFAVPDWANPEKLYQQLARQDSMDPDSVFGPIGPLQLEEVFRGTNKDRLRRFRERTSSANWNLSGDGLTSEEVHRDRIGRETVRRNGGWVFGMEAGQQQGKGN